MPKTCAIVQVRVAALVLLVLLGSAFPVHPQVRDGISGTVRDRSTGDPVPGALIEVRGFDGSQIGALGLQALTGPRGEFTFAGADEGDYLVSVEHLAYGSHVHPLRLEGEGTAMVEIMISPAAIDLAPVIVDAAAARELSELASPASRNILTREELARAAASGVTLGDYLRREVAGISVRSPAGGDVGGYLCIEFRGARREEGRCRPPELILDGTVVPNPLNFFGDFSLDGLERVQVIPPAEAGGRFGPNGGWGVILLETRRGGVDIRNDVPVARRTLVSNRFDWSLETESHGWAKVYGAAFLGNAAGLAAAGALLSNCVDLNTRTFYRGEDYCGAAPLLASGIIAAVLPPITASLAGRWAGRTDRSVGRFRQSILYSLPAFVPGFALAAVNAGDPELNGLEITGLAIIVIGAPVLNTIADRLFRDFR